MLSLARALSNYQVGFSESNNGQGIDSGKKHNREEKKHENDGVERQEIGRDNDDEEEAIWRAAREGKSETDINVLYLLVWW